MTKKATKKAFIIDTSVILFDHNSLYTFSEHDVVVPISVLEEIDTFKKGSGSLNFEAREFTRKLDVLSEGKVLNDFLDIENGANGRLKVEMKESSTPNACEVFGEKKVDASAKKLVRPPSAPTFSRESDQIDGTFS